MRDPVITERPAISFPVGFHDLHPDISINFQLNRFYGWADDDSMLTEMRQAAAGVQDYPTFTKSFIDLGEKALARNEVLKGAYYLRLAEFFLLSSDPRKHTVTCAEPFDVTTNGNNFTSEFVAEHERKLWPQDCVNRAELLVQSKCAGRAGGLVAGRILRNCAGECLVHGWVSAFLVRTFLVRTLRPARLAGLFFIEPNCMKKPR